MMLLHWFGPVAAITFKIVDACIQQHRRPGLDDGGVSPEELQNAIEALARQWIQPTASAYIPLCPNDVAACTFLDTTTAPFIAFVWPAHLSWIHRSMAWLQRVHPQRANQVPLSHHTVVVVGQEKGDVVVHDPDLHTYKGGAKQRYRRKTFLRAWRMSGYYAVCLEE
jgi:hypothetical protein